MATQMGADAHDATGIANNASTFKSQGYSFVAQYIDKYSDANTGGSPSITPAQAQTDSNAGLQLVSIFQTNGMSSSTGTGYQTYFTAAQGTADAQEAIASAQALGQPAGSAIYFAMDFDPAVYGAAGSEANLLAEVRTYLSSVQTALSQAGYTTGVYGAGDTLAAAIRTSPAVAQYGWLTQSYGWAGSNPQTDTNAQNWDIYQGAQTTQNGVAIDPDTASSNTFGAFTVCYVTGTRIRTTRGEVPVEELVIGDLAVTASGAHRPIRWLGHRTVNCRSHSAPRETMPVRIAAHAFGLNKPIRDLYVSPGHSICIDVLGEVLIPASALINGSTIQQIQVDAVTYWHVELDSHDILLAENLAAESYLDMGNRGFFREAGIIDLKAMPDAAIDDSIRTRADFCRPFHSEGPLVDVVRKQIGLRAMTLGWTLEHEPLADLHLMVDGKRITPAVRGFTARFFIPADAKSVWLVSDTSRPSEVFNSDDCRDLGVCLSGLAINDGFGTIRPIDVADPQLYLGFHQVEDDARRWTAGRARLPISLWKDCRDGFFLRVDLAGAALPRWVAPTAARVQDDNIDRPSRRSGIAAV